MSAQSHPLAVPSAQPSPQLFFDTINAYQRTAVLKTAIELELFTAIAEGERTAEAIALRTQASVRGVRILSDALVVIGFLTKQGNEYGLTPDSAVFLDRRSPAYIGNAVNFLADDNIHEGFQRLTDSVRQGTTANPDAKPF